jgi:hypothetical protein
MRILGMLVVAFALSACVSPDVVYQRSLATPHPGVPRADFEQIAQLLSHRTRRSIAKIEALPNNEVMVHAAFPGEGPNSGEDFALVKEHGRWRTLTSRDTVIL